MQRHLEFVTLWAALFLVTFTFFLWHEGSVALAIGYATVVAAIKAAVVQLHHYLWSTMAQVAAESEPLSPS